MSPWLGALRRRGPAARTQPAARLMAAPSMGRERPAPAPAPLGARVRTVVDTVRSLKEAPKTPAEIERDTAALRADGVIPADLLHRVLAGDNGATVDLTAVQLTTLADCYGLTPAYFLGTDAEVEEIEAGLEYLRLVRDPSTIGVPYLCTRSGAVNARLLRAHSQLMQEAPRLLAEHRGGTAPPSTNPPGTRS